MFVSKHRRILLMAVFVLFAEVKGFSQVVIALDAPNSSDEEFFTITAHFQTNFFNNSQIYLDVSFPAGVEKVEISNDYDWDSADIYKVNETINHKDDGPITAKYILVSAFNQGIINGEDYRLKIKVFPNQSGDIPIYRRGTIILGSDKSIWPPSSSYIDQQGYPVYRRTVVNNPEIVVSFDLLSYDVTDGPLFVNDRIRIDDYKLRASISPSSEIVTIKSLILEREDNNIEFEDNDNEISNIDEDIGDNETYTERRNIYVFGRKKGLHNLELNVEFEKPNGDTQTLKAGEVELEIENSPPEFINQPDIEIFRENEINFRLEATDPDGDILNFRMNSPLKSNAITFNPATGEFSWKPDKTHRGGYTFVFTVYDNDNSNQETDQQEVNITIKTTDLILLVHGFHGDESAFGDLNDLLFDDFPNAEVINFNYTTRLILEKGNRFADNSSIFSKSLESNAEDLNDFILEHRIFGEQTSIIAHSMGGLIARYLISEVDKIYQINKLITLGTPNNGAGLTFLGLEQPAINIQETELSIGSQFLWDLNKSWESLISGFDKQNYLNIFGNVHGITLRFDEGEGDGIVDIASSNMQNYGVTNYFLDRLKHSESVIKAGVQNIASIENRSHPLFYPILEFLKHSIIPESPSDRDAIKLQTLRKSNFILNILNSENESISFPNVIFDIWLPFIDVEDFIHWPENIEDNNYLPSISGMSNYLIGSNRNLQNSFNYWVRGITLDDVVQNVDLSINFPLYKPQQINFDLHAGQTTINEVILERSSFLDFGKELVNYSGILDSISTINIQDTSSIIALNYEDKSSLLVNFKTHDISGKNIHIERINSITDYNPSAPNTANELYVYDINTDAETYNAELFIQYTDSMLIQNSMPEQENFKVSYLAKHGSDYFWEQVDFDVDPSTNLIRINTNHFSTWLIEADVITDVSENPSVIPNKFELHQNYPNPFNPTTNISLEIPSLSNVTLDVFNILGQKVRSLINQQLLAGSYTFIWDGKDDSGKQVASGIYLYKLSANNKIQTKKMLLIR